MKCWFLVAVNVRQHLNRSHFRINHFWHLIKAIYFIKKKLNLNVKWNINYDIYFSIFILRLTDHVQSIEVVNSFNTSSHRKCFHFIETIKSVNCLLIIFFFSPCDRLLKLRFPSSWSILYQRLENDKKKAYADGTIRYDNNKNMCVQPLNCCIVMLNRWEPPAQHQ